ncbi:MAG: hypothetical protein KKH98_13380, partial [Spirochaetes bacterium]|nr:hypothetical protein [Spirochaetota bacterium]
TPAYVYSHEILLDNMGEYSNNLGGRCGMYMSEPSKVHFIKPYQMKRNGKDDQVLKIKWIKKGDGGKDKKGGWCGYYTILKTGRKYLDVSSYKRLTFWVKGEKGDENFVVGLADRSFEKRDDSVKSESITKYLPSKKVTTRWQKASIPIKDFFLELSSIYSLSICFESFLYPNNASKGTIYIDEMKFEK